MAKKGSANTIAELNVAIGADNTEVNASMAGVRAEVDRTAAHTETATRSTAGFFRSINNGAKDSIGLFRNLLGRMMAFGAIVTLFERLGATIRQTFQTGAENAEAFRNSLDLRNAVQSFDALDKRIIEIEARIAKIREGGIEGFWNKIANADAIFGDLGSEAEELAKARDSLNKQAQALIAREKEKSEEESRKKRIEADRKAASAAIRETMTEEERLTAERLDAELELGRRNLQKLTEEERSALRDRIEATKQLFEFRKKKLEEERRAEGEAARKKLQAEKEAAERTAKSINEIFANAAKDRDRELLASINNIAVAMNAANQKLDLIGRLTRQ